MEISDLARQLWEQLGLTWKQNGEGKVVVKGEPEKGELVYENSSGSWLIYSRNGISLQVNDVGSKPVLMYSAEQDKAELASARLRATTDLGRQLLSSKNYYTTNGFVMNSTTLDSLDGVSELFVSFIKPRE